MINKQRKEKKLTFLNHLHWVATEFTKLVFKEKKLFAQ
jgi:hypothetical protein